MSIHAACRRSMLCCPCMGQLTLSLEEQGQNLKVSMCYSAQGALPVCFTLPGGVVVAVHCCLTVNRIRIHWLQQNRAPLSAAAVMGHIACFITVEWPNRKLPVDSTTCVSQAFPTLACLICMQASAMHCDQHLQFLPYANSTEITWQRLSTTACNACLVDWA